MGRPSGGHSSHSSSSHRSSNHRGSSHRRSSSSRPISRSSSTYRSRSSSHSYRHTSCGSYGGYRGTSTGFVSRLLGAVRTMILVFCLFMFVLWIMYEQQPKSTVNREKLTDISAYNNNCVIDELDWFDNKSYVGKKLKNFYEKTGIQPYVYLKKYSDDLKNDSDREDWADEYFDNKGYGSSDLVFIYFAEKSDYDMGLEVLRYGNGAGTIMDSEACDIFWSWIDYYWDNEDLSMDDVIVNTFTKTGNTIMKVSKSLVDLLYPIIIFIGLLTVLIVVLVIIRTISTERQRQRESDERILNTQIDPIQGSTDDLINQYRS